MTKTRLSVAFSVLSVASVIPFAAAAEEIKLPSGATVAIEGKSTGAQKLSSSSTVTVHFESLLTDGTIFDRSYKCVAQATLPLSGVIPCWIQSVSAMSVGDTAVLTCPSALAYGSCGAPLTIPPNAVLEFKVELIEILS